MNFFRHNFLTRFLAALLTTISLSGTASSQEWVQSMFEETSHDFGTVPRGAKAEYKFKLTNKFVEDVHIAQVKTSCGCTIPRIENADLKTYQVGAIACEFNTRSFIGGRSAVVTVVFDKPYFGEMQLLVKGNIRSDIVTEPGEIQFGQVDRGAEKSTSVRISYAGTSNWEIKDVRSANQSLAVNLDRLDSGNGRIEYLMKVRLKDDAPAGDFSDQIVLVTNESDFNLVTVPVRGNIVPPLVMPASIELGSVTSGVALKDKMVIRGNEPFEITRVECADDRFSFQPPTGKKAAHIIPFSFDATGTEGAFIEKVSVHTSLEKDGVASTMVSGNIAK